MNKLKPKTVYIHIPKCAGNSVFRSLHIATGSKKNMMQDSIAIHNSARLFSKLQDEDKFQERLLLNKQVLLAFHLNQDFTCIGGHFVFCPLIHSSVSSEVNFFTLLRDPVKRLKSHISYLLLAHPRTCVEDYMTGVVSIEEEISVMLNDPLSKWLGRQQCLYLGGLNHKGDADLENCLDNAKKSLKLFDLIGFVDNLDNFTESFFKKYKKTLITKHQNTIQTVANNNTILLQKINLCLNSHEKKIKELSELDIELFDYAIKNFN